MSASLTPIYGKAAPKSRTRDLPLMGEDTYHRTKCDLCTTRNPKKEKCSSQLQMTSIIISRRTAAVQEFYLIMVKSSRSQ
ncbi:hypothetical protein DVH24_041812 [Malus domestica]|uniref:Uncharacterized protein n=1 Tax=Malus domestica TaxID=3750 RepID=A0A498IS73_MALDO|nr:hypothetical protein DVH24_041812 [Malus domestica]